MSHPLFALIESRPDSQLVATPQIAGLQPSPGCALPGGEGEGEGGGGRGAALPQAAGFRVGNTRCLILAVQDPPQADGRPGTIHWAEGLSLVERRRVKSGFDWFDRMGPRLAALVVSRVEVHARSPGRGLRRLPTESARLTDEERRAFVESE